MTVSLTKFSTQLNFAIIPILKPLAASQKRFLLVAEFLEKVHIFISVTVQSAHFLANDDPFLIIKRTFSFLNISNDFFESK